MEKTTIAIIVGVVVAVVVAISSIRQPLDIITPTIIQDGVVQVLIGGGPEDILLPKIAGIVPWFDRTIDVLVVPSLTKQGVQGLASVMNRYGIGMVILPHVQPSDPESRNFLQMIISKHIPYRFAAYGQQLAAGDISLRFLAPIANVSNIVVRVDDQKLSFVSSFPKGVSEKTFRTLGVPDEALRVSLPSFASNQDEHFISLNGNWFVKCENETDLPFLQHVCTNRSWQSNEHL